MKSVATTERRISSRIPEGQTGLTLLDATVTGKKAKELEAKLHRLVIGQEEAIQEIGRIRLMSPGFHRLPDRLETSCSSGLRDREDTRRGGDRRGASRQSAGCH
jgi:hypothetical protein